MSMPLARTYSDEDSNDGDGTVQDTDPDHPDPTSTTDGFPNHEHGANDMVTNGGAALPSQAAQNGHSRVQMITDPIRRFLKVASIEPVLFLFRFAFSITDVTTQRLYMETVCLDKYPDKMEIDCSNLTETEKKGLETDTTKFFTYREIIEYGVPILIIILMGQYVDKHGSKFPMIYTCVCSATSCLIYLILSFVSHLHPSELLFASIPIAMGSSFVVFLMSSLKHIASNTSTESRSFRIAVAEIIWQVGSPVGLMAALPILKDFGYKAIFMIAAVFYIFCVIYIVLLVKNDKPQNELVPLELQEPDSFKCRPLFQLSNLTDTFHSCFRRRSGLRRIWLMTLFVILFFRFLVMIGDIDIAYLYTYHKFSWTSRDYSIYQTCAGVFGILGSLFLSVVSLKVLPWSDPMVGLISAVSWFCGLITVTVATRGFVMYLGAGLQMFSRLITIIVRSLSSKIVSKQEVGKIYSFIGCIESITPLLASLIFNYIFIQTKDTFTGAVYVVCSSLAAVIAILYLFLYISMRGYQLHQEVEGHPAGVET